LTFFPPSGKRNDVPTGKEGPILRLANVPQTAPVLVREGLPYWIFWLLLCFILLLLAFIFLRDKDLRRRLNFLLSKPKLRFRLTRLKLRLNRAKKRRAGLHRDLGKKAWLGRIEPSRFESLYRELELLERSLERGQAELTESRVRSLSSQARLDELRLRRKSLLREREEGRGFDAQAFRQAKDEEIRLKKEAKGLKRAVEAGESQTRRLAALKEDRFLDLGEKVDERRLDHPDLALLYAEIDKLNRTIVAYLDQIDALR